MSVATADLCTGINNAWDSGGLEDLFKGLWSSGSDTSEFHALHHQMAPGEQPFPYCVLGEITSDVVTRMSDTATRRRIIQDVSIPFHVLAKERDGDSRSAMQIAAYLAEEIMKVFGGHPEQSASQEISLAHGDHLITQKINDFPVNTGEQECQWTIEYIFRIDVPVY